MAARPATGLDTRTLELALSAVEATISLVIEGGPSWRPLVEEVEAAAQLEEAISGREEAPPTPTRAPSKRQPKRGGKRSDVEPAERRKQIVALLVERGPLGPQEIKAAIPMSSSQGVADFRKLTEAGEIRRTGPQTRPIYEAVTGGAEPSSPPPAATLGGRVIGYINDHEKATEETLADALGATDEEIRAAVGALVREGEVRYRQIDGQTYVVEDPSAA